MQVLANRGRTAPERAHGAVPRAADPDGPIASHAVAGRHMPALDGLRAVAVGAVIAYHFGFSWAAGGYLGVDLFFVLSGFLITGLLLEERADTGSIRLGGFWARRAKRLLPGLLLMLLVLSAFVALEGSKLSLDIEQLRGDALASIFYVANWHLLLAHQSYFGEFFAKPSPLGHTWSLAIEEQFYLLWPLVLIAFVRVRPRTSRGSSRTHPVGDRRAPGFTSAALSGARRRGLVVLCAAGAAASAAWMAWLAGHGASLNRLYYGTDTRAFDLLAGATVAVAAVSRPAPGVRARRWLHIGSVAGACVLAVCFWRAGGPAQAPHWMFQWGFLLCAVCAALVVADVRQESPGPLGRVLGLRPLRWVGIISYGLYLWHWPAIVLLTPKVTAVRPGLDLDALRLGVTFAAATASFYLVERPIRRGSFSRWPDGLRLAAAPCAMTATAIVALAVIVPASASARAPSVHLTSTTAVPGAGGISGEEQIRLPASQKPSGSHRLRVMLLGDSVMYVDAPAVQAALDSTGVVEVVDHAFPGWGLTTDANWPHDVLGAVEEVHPQIVVAMWSWDNTLAVEQPRAYEQELQHFVRVLLTPGDGVGGVIFQQFPVEGPVVGAVDQSQEESQTRARDAGVRQWNSMVSSLPAVFPGRVMFFPVGAAIELAGHFAVWLPPPGDKTSEQRWVRVRMVDDVHFCPAGAARYADALLADMTSVFRLPPAAATWSTGGWANDARYLDADGLSSSPCPDDHPGG